ncbi:MAG TPA: hypothetical protein VF458_03290, partial [Ktedonobacteraceae bacterium]
MSTQPPLDPSGRQASPASSCPPGGARPVAPSEYIPLDAPPSPARPMPRPAYLYPLLYTPVPGAS